MKQPAHAMSFSIGYSQYRDYYLYRLNRIGHRPAWLVPELFLAAGVLAAVLSLAFRAGKLTGYLSFFPLIAQTLSFLCVGAYFVVRLGWLFHIRNKARRQYRLQRLGGQKSQIRLYEDFFTVHYPSAAFDCLYEEIRSMDRTRYLTVLLLQNGAQAPIPIDQWSPQITAFFMQKMKK